MFGTPTKQIGDVVTAVNRQFGDESGVQLLPTDIIRWINDGQQEIVKSNRILKAKGTVSSFAGTQALDVTALSIFQIESIHYNGVLLPNVSWAQAELQVSTNDPLVDQGGMPSFWYEFGGQILLYPIPAETVPVQVYYTVAPPVYASNAALTTVLFVPDRYFVALVKFIMQMAYEMDENYEASAAKEKQFSTALDDFGEEDRTSSNMTYQTITVVD